MLCRASSVLFARIKYTMLYWAMHRRYAARSGRIFSRRSTLPRLRPLTKRHVHFGVNLGHFVFDFSLFFGRSATHGDARNAFLADEKSPTDTLRTNENNADAGRATRRGAGRRETERRSSRRGRFIGSFPHSADGALPPPTASRYNLNQ